MAKEKHEPEAKPKHEAAHGKSEGGKGKKKHLHQIVTTFAHDGSAVHEHVYKDKKEDHHTHPPVFAGTSQTLEDLHDHMDDHAGPSMNGGGGQEEEEEEAGGAPGGGGQQEEPGEPGE